MFWECSTRSLPLCLGGGGAGACSTNGNMPRRTRCTRRKKARSVAISTEASRWWRTPPKTSSKNSWRLALAISANGKSSCRNGSAARDRGVLEGRYDVRGTTSAAATQERHSPVYVFHRPHQSISPRRPNPPPADCASRFWRAILSACAVIRQFHDGVCEHVCDWMVSIV